MEKTPSVMISRTRLSWCSWSFSSRCPMSECLKVSCIALHRRIPSTIEAWTRRSAIITSCSVRTASKTPALASMQQGKRIVSSVPRNSVSFCSSSRWMSCVPQMKRTRGHAVAALVEPLVRRRDHVGVAGEAEVVVGAQVDDLLERSARGELDLDLGPLRRVDEPLLLEEAGAWMPRSLLLVTPRGPCTVVG